MRKRYCRICRNLNDGTNKLLNFNRLIAEASDSLETLADSISHYIVRRRRKVRGVYKWVDSDPPRRVLYSPIEVGLHRDQCLRGVVEKGLELANPPKPNETAIERADRLYQKNERVLNVIVEHILSKHSRSQEAAFIGSRSKGKAKVEAQAKADDLQVTEHELSLVDRFTENMMKINQFRAKVMAEALPPQEAKNKAAELPAAGSVHVTNGLFLPSTFGKSDDEVKRMITEGIQQPTKPIIDIPSKKDAKDIQ